MSNAVFIPKSETISTRHADCDWDYMVCANSFYGQKPYLHVMRIATLLLLTSCLFLSSQKPYLHVMRIATCYSSAQSRSNQGQKPYLHVMRIATVKNTILVLFMNVRNHIYTSCGLRLGNVFNLDYWILSETISTRHADCDFISRLVTTGSSESETISTRHADCDCPCCCCCYVYHLSETISTRHADCDSLTKI